MDKDILKGVKFGIGIIISLSIFFGIVFAAGFHSANEIFSGVFNGDYSFNGSIVIVENLNLNGSIVSNSTITANGLYLGNGSTTCELSTKGQLRYNGVNNTVDFCNGVSWTRFTDMDNYYGNFATGSATLSPSGNPSLNSAAGTFETWINPGEDLSTSGNYIFEKHQCTYGGWQVFISGGRLTSYYYNSGWNTWNTSSQTWNQGQWYHIAATRGPAGIKLYINGALMASDPSKTASFSEYGTGTQRLGGGSIGCGGGYYIGGMDDSRLWLRQLDDSEISDIYSRGRGSPLNISTTSLTWYYTYEQNFEDQANSYDGSNSGVTFEK